jgi:predicted PurR-regulated permease PerM
VVSGYVIGQAIISTLFGIYSYSVLSILNVPQPLLLALFSAVAVVIPIVGAPVATIAAMAIALSVSWQTSLIVLAAFALYQQFENYVLLPRVYGNTLRVSSLSILVGVLVGNQLLGVLGIILSLPLTASIPVIERVWRERVPDDIEALEQTAVTQEPTPTEIVKGTRS